MSDIQALFAWATADHERLLVRALRDRAGLSSDEQSAVIALALRMFGDLANELFRRMVFGASLSRAEKDLHEQLFNLLIALSDMTPGQIGEAALAASWEHRNDPTP